MSDSDNSSSSNIGKSWTKDEEEILVREYTIDKLNINEIALNHKRKRGGIRTRLIKLGLIESNKNPVEQSTEDTLNNIYQNIINEYTNKENELAAKIKYYNEHKEQLIRIKLLEAEFTNLQNDINTISAKKIMEIENKKREDEYFKIISENCKDAFQMYLLNLRNSRKNPHQIQMNTLCRKFYINYTFNKINDNSYKVISNIPNYPGGIGMTPEGDITAIYDVENGFKLC